MVGASSQPSSKLPEKLDPRRFEWAGFPIIGGNSDIGVMGGVAATFTRFREGVFPYFWNLDVVLSASAKDDPSITFIQQADVLRLDAPDLANHHLRLDTRASFTRTINEGYYGIGNASTANPAPGETNLVRVNQYVAEEVRVREISRIHTGLKMLDIALGGNMRYEWPSIYAGSRLAADSTARNPDGSPLIYGVQNEGLASVAAGVIIDTRDNEFITTHGIYYQVGFGATVGTGESIRYAQASGVLAHYAKLVGPFDPRHPDRR